MLAVEIDRFESELNKKKPYFEKAAKAIVEAINEEDT